MQKLVIQDDEGKTTVVPLIKDEITVGRKEGNTIRLTERNVSRQHARILRNNGTIEIEDLDSYNGVKVNGSRIQGRMGLNPSDRIQIGDYLIELKADGSPLPSSGPVDEQPTRPIPQAGISATGLPAVPTEAIEDAPTTKVPSSITFPGLTTGSGAPPADPLANTDPGRPAAVAAPEPAAPVESSHGRVVLLSDNFAGQEFLLDRATMIVGRTDDNDVVVNHRSISRHHAKVVRENGRYAIIDLQSSNGVRVNGEEYGKVELRRGDVIDLGHVRLRFVEPGEDFLFGRDAQAVPIPSGGSRTMLYGIIAIIIIAAVGAFALTRNSEGDEQQEVTPTQSDPTSTDPPPNEVRATTTDKPKTQEIPKLLAGIKANLKDEEWQSAKEKAEKVLELDPGNQTAGQELAKAEFEIGNQKLLEKFKAAVAEEDYPAIASTFRELDETSVYHDQARDDYEQMGRKYASSKETEAKSLANAKKCKEINDLRSDVEKLFPAAAGKLEEQQKRCRQRLAKAGSKPDRPTVKNPTSGDSKRPPPEKSSPEKSYDELVDDMRKAAGKGYYARALSFCKQAYKKKSSGSLATNCGVFACYAKRLGDAKRFHKSADKKSSVQQTCLKHGLDPK